MYDERVKNVVLKPTKRRCWWMDPEDGRTQEYMSGKRCSPSEYHLTNTDLVLNPKQAPEHSKPPTFLLKYTWVYILYCALSIGAELKPVAACITLSTIYIHELPCFNVCELELGLGPDYYSYHVTCFLAKPSMLLYSINGCPVESNERIKHQPSLYVCILSYTCHKLLDVCLTSLVLHHIIHILHLCIYYIGTLDVWWKGEERGAEINQKAMLVNGSKRWEDPRNTCRARDARQANIIKQTLT